MKRLSLDAVAALLRQRIAIDEQIAAALEVASSFDGGVSESLSSTELPPDVRHLANPRRVVAERCRAGLVRGAEKRGRDWYFTCAAWAESRRSPAPPLCLVPSPVADDEAIAMSALDAAGLRSTSRRSA